MERDSEGEWAIERERRAGLPQKGPVNTHAQPWVIWLQHADSGCWYEDHKKNWRWCWQQSGIHWFFSSFFYATDFPFFCQQERKKRKKDRNTRKTEWYQRKNERKKERTLKTHSRSMFWGLSSVNMSACMHVCVRKRCVCLCVHARAFACECVCVCTCAALS